MSYDICSKRKQPTFRCECKKKLDADGVPVDANQWTEADWATLYHGMAKIKSAIAGRHKEKTNAT